MNPVIIIVVAVIIFIIIIILGWLIGMYNSFVTAIQDIKNMWSNITTEYQRRADLFMNLVESVKAYTKFEKETLTQVAQARSGNFAGTPQQQMKQLKGLDAAFQRLMVVVEQYPKLKAGKQYIMLMNDIRETEDRINIARTDYNELVRDYNVYVVRFPHSIMAAMFRFKEWEYFESDDKDIKKSPKINLSFT